MCTQIITMISFPIIFLTELLKYVSYICMLYNVGKYIGKFLFRWRSIKEFNKSFEQDSVVTPFRTRFAHAKISEPCNVKGIFGQYNIEIRLFTEMCGPNTKYIDIKGKLCSNHEHILANSLTNVIYCNYFLYILFSVHTRSYLPYTKFDGEKEDAVILYKIIS